MKKIFKAEPTNQNFPSKTRWLISNLVSLKPTLKKILWASFGINLIIIASAILVMFMFDKGLFSEDLRFLQMLLLAGALILAVEFFIRTIRA